MKKQHRLTILALAALLAAGTHLMQTPPARAEAEAVRDRSNQVAEATGRNVAPTRPARTDVSFVIEARRQEIYGDPAAPMIGNPQGPLTVVMFFDYRCPYCKRVAPVMEELVRSDPSVRIVYKELPILGAGSVIAARAALAADRQGKYIAFHRALMRTRGRISEATILSAASRVGLDLPSLQRDMADPAIDRALERNRDLAAALRISGTPAYVINDRVERGTGDAEDFRELLEADLALR